MPSLKQMEDVPNTTTEILLFSQFIAADFLLRKIRIERTVETFPLVVSDFWTQFYYTFGFFFFLCCLSLHYLVSHPDFPKTSRTPPGFL